MLAERSQYAIHQDPEIGQLKAALLKDIQRSVFVYRVDCGGCNGCEIEIFAALTPLFDVERFGIKVVSSPRHADVLVFTGSMTRSMRVPALRAYHAAPDPKICVAYGACGCSGGIFHDLYCVWGGADKVVPVDVYIPGCPPTPAATIYGFAMALGILSQKLKAVHHVQSENEHVLPRHPEIPLILRVEIEREARRMAGYWHGKRIAETFFGLIKGDSQPIEQTVRAYLEQEDDPRLTEIVTRLESIYHAYHGAR
ncbi:MAG: NADH-quinone oxidoreductase subunit B family protein [Anaerolineae bacterium]|nr:MAG: NADH-quinone oxidoreductase subunit B family protein [Anaerolineae bacterium]